MADIQDLIEQAVLQIQPILTEDQFVDDVRWNSAEFQFEIRTIDSHLATFRYSPEATLADQIARFIRYFKEDYL